MKTAGPCMLHFHVGCAVVAGQLVTRVSRRVILVDFRKLKSCRHLRASAEAGEDAASNDDGRLELCEAAAVGALGIRERILNPSTDSC